MVIQQKESMNIDPIFIKTKIENSNSGNHNSNYTKWKNPEIDEETVKAQITKELRHLQEIGNNKRLKDGIVDNSKVDTETSRRYIIEAEVDLNQI